MTRALVLSEHDLEEYGRRFAKGEAPSAMPYGIDALSSLGWQLLGAARSRGRAVTKVRDVIEHRAGLAVERTLRGVRKANRADVVIALLEREGMAASTWKRTGLPPYAGTPLVIMTCWLGEDLRGANADQRRRLVRRVAGADLITHMSSGERELYLDAGIPEHRLVTATFGVSHRYYTPDPSTVRDIPVLAVGQDRGRDYETLFAAIRGSGIPVEVYCRPANVRGMDVPSEVTIYDPVSLPEYRQLLRRARVVAVPTHDLAYPTGQSVGLEAAAVGACVVVTGTRAMSDYFIDGVTGRLVRVGDVDAWRSVITELADDEPQRDRLGTAARDSVERIFNTEHMWTELASVMADRSLVPRRTSLLP